jgi:hypothetical protein
VLGGAMDSSFIVIHHHLLINNSEISPLKYLTDSSFLPLINDEKQYFLLHNKLISQPTTVSDDTDNINNEYIEQIKTTGSTKKVKNDGNKLIIHYTYETRFQ